MPNIAPMNVVRTEKSSGGRWLLVGISAFTRVLGAFLLPNAFGDAYVYIRDIGNFSTRLTAGTLRLTDLFGFWLPLYQLVAAALNVFVVNGFYSGKIVSAIFGAGVCWFVYGVTEQLTQNKRAAFWMCLLITLSPLHIFYSASAMTDVPHAFFVIASLYFALRQKWIAAAVFGALAGFTRVESWMLIGLLPFLQIVRRRRLSLPAMVILILPPLFWSGSRRMYSCRRRCRRSALFTTFSRLHHRFCITTPLKAGCSALSQVRRFGRRILSI